MRNDRNTLAYEVREEILCQLRKLHGTPKMDDDARIWKAVEDPNKKVFVVLKFHPCDNNVHVVDGKRTPENVRTLRRLMAPDAKTYVVQYGEVRLITDEQVEREFRGIICRRESEREPGYMRAFHDGGGEVVRPKHKFHTKSKRDFELSIRKFNALYERYDVQMF